MGTPGDKTKISKVVTTPVDPEEANLPVSPVSLPIDSSTSTMGVISRLPHFETIAASNIFPSVPQSVSKPDVLQLGVEQGQIDYYYTHSKYYPSVSETPPPVYPPATVKSQKTFPVNIDEPGPSGIQTPKTKPSASLLKVKKNKKPVSSPATPKKTYTCPICQKNYASSEKLIKHQQTHTFSSPFKCENCKKVFTSKFKLVRHKLIHSDSKPFVCTVCERTFHRKDHLKNHFKVHSPCKEIYVCEKPNCKKEYTSLLSYRKHLAIHEAEEGNLQCQICQYVSKSKEDIIFHLKRHAGSRTVKNPNEKKYTCDQCDRKFFTKKDVRRHLVVHTGMRDFLCQFCPQRFGRKDHLVRHIKKSHNKKFMSEETSVVKVEKKDLPQTVTSAENLKLEIKSEGDTSSVSNPADFALDYFQNVGTMFDESLLFQSPSSTQTELRDLGPILEEEIASTSTDPSMLLVDNFDVPNQNVLNESDLARLLDSTEDVNTPLPPFSKTFQPPNA